MKSIEIHITEKDKMGKQLTLLNFRDELVNFMYKKTIADSSRTSMRFFVLVFFLSLKTGPKSLLMSLFDDNLEKIKRLNESFFNKKKLKRGEYTELIKKNGLDQVFKYDTFFILITAVLDSEKILLKFKDYFSENSDIKEEFLRVVKKYQNQLKRFDSDFKTHLIADDRINEWGETHDLSKSVYRTIKMRTSRSLDLELHKYAELKIVTSQSPIYLTIVQHIDPRIIISLWDTYKLGDYVKLVWDFSNQPLPAATIAGSWLNWKLTDSKKRKEKAKAKDDFEAQLKQSEKENKGLLQLAEVLAASVVKSNEFLQDEIKKLKAQKTIALEDRISSDRRQKIKELEERIEKLENINIDASEIDSK